MSLESATYVSQLSANDPQSSDPRSQGDDHLRLLKSVLKTDLGPNNRQWVYTAHSASWVTSSIVSFPSDLTTVYEVGRRVKVVGSATGTLYGTVASSTYSAATAVNLTFDAGGMTNEALQVFVSPLTPSNTSLPRGGLASVKGYGAKGDGVTDDYSAFAAVIAQGLIPYCDPGDYLLSQTIDLGVDNNGYGIVGAGRDIVTLRATHSSGAVIRLHDRMQFLQGFTVTSSSGRRTGAAGSNYGVLIQPDDTVGQDCHDWYLDISIENQPSHGLAIVGAQFGGVYDRLRIEDNLGHGVIIDNGTLTGMTNKSRPGSIQFRGGHVNDNAGHCFKIGDDDGSDNYPLRIEINNVDTFRNALDASVRKSTHSLWAYMEGSQINMCGLGGRNTAGPQTVSGLFLAGRDNYVYQPRFINTLQPPAEIGSIAVDGIPSVGNHILAGFVSGIDGSASANPMVVIDASAFESVVTSHRFSEVAQAATPSKRTEWSRGNEHFAHGDYMYSSVNSTREFSANDDSAFSVQFDTNPTSGICVLASNVSAGGSCMIHFRVGSTPSVTFLGRANNVTATSSTTLAGTTQSDAHLNISASNDRRLYVENRTGGVRNYRLTFLSMVGGKLLPSSMDSG